MFLAKEVFVFSFCLLAFASVVSAASVGVTPAKYEIAFEPNLEQTFEFQFESDFDEAVFDVLVRGDLAPYARVDREQFSGREGVVVVTLKLPEVLDRPGEHRLLIGASPSSDSGGGTAVGIVGIVNGLVRVRVPYPGQYADVSFSTEDANSGERVLYLLEIFSRGQESIVARSSIEIYDSSDEKVSEFTLDSREVGPSERAEIRDSFDVSGLDPGTYRAVAHVLYAGEERQAESSFRLGELFIALTNYTQLFDRGGINQIIVEVESGWNDLVEGVFVTGDVEGYDLSFRTPAIELAPWSRGKLEGFFDTSEIKGDEFVMNLAVHYEGEVTEEQVVMMLAEREINYLLWGGILAGIVLVGFVIWVIVTLKRLERKSGRGKK